VSPTIYQYGNYASTLHSMTFSSNRKTKYSKGFPAISAR